MDPPSVSQLESKWQTSEQNLAIRTSGQQKSEWANKNLIYDHHQSALIWFKEGWGIPTGDVWVWVSGTAVHWAMNGKNE